MKHGDDATSTTTTATATRGEAVLEQHDDEALVLEPAHRRRRRREGRRFGILNFGVFDLGIIFYRQRKSFLRERENEVTEKEMKMAIGGVMIFISSSSRR
ncbi:hypothetical protein Q3G72_007991 [Acer saccharum]|nr:hypothetical protein Q3G72_007991 [Acer saccharum]